MYIRKNITVSFCEIHGESKYIGNLCIVCKNRKNISFMKCDNHGLTKFIGKKCYMCRKTCFSKAKCNLHGDSYYQGGKCVKCVFAEKQHFDKCPTHGDALFIGNTCAQCRSQNAITMSICELHGMTKHRGVSCSRCNAMKAAHNLYTNEKTNLNCPACLSEIDDNKRSEIITIVKQNQSCELCGKVFYLRKKDRDFALILMKQIVMFVKKLFILFYEKIKKYMYVIIKDVSQ